jgi:DnaJ-class molecular chaperone
MIRRRHFLACTAALVATACGCESGGGVKCYACKGKGKSQCYQCNGKGGYYRTTQQTKYWEKQEYMRCALCNGAGSTKCSTCSGSGRAPITKV